MAKFDRSQFKATRVDTLVEQSKEVQSTTGSSSSDRAKVLELKRDGSKNKLRIFPKHPDAKSWCYPKTVHFLKVTYTDKDGNVIKDDKGNPKTGKRPIFNSRVHGDTQKDIIDEYINFVYKRAYDEIQDEDTRKKFLRPIEGWKAGGTWNPGIKSQTRWMIYGDLNGTFGRVELPTTVKNRLNEIAAGQDDESGAIVVDPFTDIDEGRKVFITYDKSEKDPAKKYSTAIDLQRATPLTDEQFEELVGQKSLQSLYHKVYKRRDFMMAMEGLKTFDEESAQTLRQMGFDSGYEVFTFDSFLDTAEEIAEYYPEDGQKEDEDSHAGDEFLSMEKDEVKAKPAPQQEVEEDDAPFDADQSDLDNIDQMDMAELKSYIKDNGLSIRVLPSYKVDQVRQFIKEEEELIAEEKAAAEDQPQKPERGSRLKNLKGRVKK